MARELATRMQHAERDTALGHYLKGFLDALERDRHVVEALLAVLGGHPSPVKQLGGWLAEKAERMKAHGLVGGAADFTRFMDLEALSLGVEGKLSLWRALDVLSRNDPRLGAVDYEDLASIASEQRRQLERFRLRAVHDAFRTPRQPTMFGEQAPQES